MKLITHNGTFHHDEVLATAILLKIYPEAEIIRTRNMSGVTAKDIVYDVGSEFNPSQNRFDHHQRSFYETFSKDHKIKLSSCGLIYKYFGEKLLRLYGLTRKNRYFNDIYVKIYNEYFLYADAIDNGVSVYGAIPTRTMSSIVKTFNPHTINEASEDEINRCFLDAVNYVTIDLDNYLNRVIQSYLKSYGACINELKGLNGDYFVTKSNFTPDLIFDVCIKLNKPFKFVIFDKKNEFRILGIRVERFSFECRALLHPKWRGIRDQKLDEVSGIQGCTFVHVNGFTGGNKTLEGAIEMVEKSLK